MAIERSYVKIDATPFTSDGLDIGLVTIADTACYKVKMIVVVKADGMDPQRFEVKRVISDTQMYLGPEKAPLKKRSDMSSYVLGINPTVEAPEQERPHIPPADYERAAYEEEPTVAKRVFNVDKYGKEYNAENPFPVDAIINLDSVEINLNRPNTHNFAKLSIATKATEVNFTFPNGTKYYQIQARGCKDVIKVGMAAGDIAAGNFWEIPFGNFFSPEELVDYPNGYTLYFESKHKDNVDLEIFYYRKL